MLLTFKLASTSFAFWERFAAVAPFWSPPQDFYRRDNSSWLTPEREYAAALYPKMNPSQRALQVPGAFGRSNDLCGHVCYANHTQKGCCTNNHRTSGQTNHSQEYGGNSFPSLFFWGGAGGQFPFFQSPESCMCVRCQLCSRCHRGAKKPPSTMDTPLRSLSTMDTPHLLALCLRCTAMTMSRMAPRFLFRIKVGGKGRVSAMVAAKTP